MDSDAPATFTPVQFDPAAVSNNRRRGVVPVQPSSSRYEPYGRSTPSSKPSTSLASASIIDDAESAQCTTDLPLDTPQSKSHFKDYTRKQQKAIDWAQKRLIMDGAIGGWIRNSTKAEKAKMTARVIEIIAQASAKFTCGM